MLTHTLIAIGGFAAGYAFCWVWTEIDSWLTQGRVAYLGFINGMEEKD